MMLFLHMSSSKWAHSLYLLRWPNLPPSEHLHQFKDSNFFVINFARFVCLGHVRIYDYGSTGINDNKSIGYVYMIMSVTDDKKLYTYISLTRKGKDRVYGKWLCCITQTKWKHLNPSQTAFLLSSSLKWLIHPCKLNTTLCRYMRESHPITTALNICHRVIWIRVTNNTESAKGVATNRNKCGIVNITNQQTII